MVIQAFESSLSDDWDAFITQSFNGTFLHSRRFLSYHQDRFKDLSLLFRDSSDKIVALLPAAQSPHSESDVISHPGITYGGLITSDKCKGGEVVLALESASTHYKNRGYERLLYKAIPHIYHSIPAQDDLYALFKLNATRYRSDLSSSINLTNRGRISSRRKRSLKKAIKSGVDTSSSLEHLEALWTVVSKNLQDKYNKKPVHSLAEIRSLADLFPSNIEINVGIHKQQVIAGILLFKSSPVVHAQYIAASKLGQQLNALDLLFESSIANAKEEGYQYFDFGISNEEEGQVLNNGLYGFKSEFGAGGVTHDFYELTLS